MNMHESRTIYDPAGKMIKASGAAALISLLAACASTPPTPPPPPPPPPQSSAPPPESQSSEQSESQTQQSESEQSQSDRAQSSQSQTGESQSEQGGQQQPAASQASSDEAGNQQQQSGSSGEQSPTGQAAATPGYKGSPGAVTRRERGEQAAGEFERSLGEFDERLAREQGELESLGDKQASANEQREQQDAGRSGSGFEGERVGVAPPPPTGVRDGTENGAERPEQSQRRRPGSPGDKASLPVPDDIPSGQGDDVVARQLREAAENETDPELREKLWDEYRQYKRNNG